HEDLRRDHVNPIPHQTNRSPAIVSVHVTAAQCSSTPTDEGGVRNEGDRRGRHTADEESGEQDTWPSIEETHVRRWGRFRPVTQRVSCNGVPLGHPPLRRDQCQ